MFRYMGGKNRMLPHILPILPDTKVYVEPFFGSGVVFFHKKPAIKEVINDRDEIIYAIYKALQDPHEAELLHRKIRLAITSQRLFRECADILNRYKSGEKLPYSEVAFAAIYYLQFAIKKGFNKINHSEFCVSNGSYTKDIAPRKAEYNFWRVVKRLRRAIIMCDDALVVMRRFDSPDTLFYLDPPYITDSEFYSHNIDHEELVRFLLNMQGMAVMSCYYHEVYEPLLENGWKMRVYNIKFAAFACNGVNNRQEVLLISPNVPIKQQATLF